MTTSEVRASCILVLYASLAASVFYPREEEVMSGWTILGVVLSCVYAAAVVASLAHDYWRKK